MFEFVLADPELEYKIRSSNWDIEIVVTTEVRTGIFADPLVGKIVFNGIEYFLIWDTTPFAFRLDNHTAYVCRSSSTTATDHDSLLDIFMSQLDGIYENVVSRLLDTFDVGFFTLAEFIVNIFEHDDCHSDNTG